MTHLLSGGLAAMLAVLALGQAEEPVRIRAADLARPSPALAARLLGRPAREYAEADVRWNEWEPEHTYARVNFATRARATGWRGLCRLDLLTFHLQSELPRSRNPLLAGEMGEVRRVYVVTGPATVPLPEPVPSAEHLAECRSAGPFLAQPEPNVSIIGVQNHSRVAEPAEAAFAYAAFAAARRSSNFINYACMVGLEPRCRDVAELVREFDVRQLTSLGIQRCRVEPSKLCISAGYPGSSRNRIMIVTDEEVPTHDPRLIRIRAVCVTAVNRLADLRSRDPC